MNWEPSLLWNFLKRTMYKIDTAENVITDMKKAGEWMQNKREK